MSNNGLRILIGSRRQCLPDTNLAWSVPGTLLPPRDERRLCDIVENARDSVAHAASIYRSSWGPNEGNSCSRQPALTRRPYGPAKLNARFLCGMRLFRRPVAASCEDSSAGDARAGGDAARIRWCRRHYTTSQLAQRPHKFVRSLNKIVWVDRYTSGAGAAPIPEGANMSGCVFYSRAASAAWCRSELRRMARPPWLM